MIGLMTPFRVSNYGTKLQAYAVQRIMSRYDDTEIIDFEPSRLDRVRHRREYVNAKRYIDTKALAGEWGSVDPSLAARRKAAIDSFDALLAVSGEIVGEVALRKHAAGYRAVVCGSDQIWNPVNLARHVYMLEFAPPSARKVAFSPSFGVDAIPQSLRRTYAKRLAGLDFLSVREKSGMGILEDLGFDKATWTLDPTLVLDAREWAELAKAPSESERPEGGYLFCYFLGNRELARIAAREVAAEKGLEIVAMPHFKGFAACDVGFADRELYDATVQNFVWLIANAQAVCTDSFHASAFAMMFSRDLYCVPRHDETEEAGTNSRVLSLLESLGAPDRILRNPDDARLVVGHEIDHAKAARALDARRLETTKYLDRAMGGLR